MKPRRIRSAAPGRRDGSHRVHVQCGAWSLIRSTTALDPFSLLEPDGTLRRSRCSDGSSASRRAPA
jgi:hypothetical protein